MIDRQKVKEDLACLILRDPVVEKHVIQLWGTDTLDTPSKIIDGLSEIDIWYLNDQINRTLIQFNGE